MWLLHCISRYDATAPRVPRPIRHARITCPDDAVFTVPIPVVSGFGVPGRGRMTLGNGAAGKTLATEAVRCIVGEFRMPRWKFRFNLKEEYP